MSIVDEVIDLLENNKNVFSNEISFNELLNKNENIAIEDEISPNVGILYPVDKSAEFILQYNVPKL